MADVGKILILPKGQYNASATYNILDVVRYNGSTFVAKKDNLTGVTPVDGADWMLMVSDGGGATTLGSLTDVDVLSATDGQYLQYVDDGVNPPEWIAADAAAAMADLTDVDLTGLVTNQYLRYNGTKWVPVTSSGSGHTMLPDPAIDPSTLNPPKTVEQNAVDAINAGVFDGYDNEDVASLNTIGWWSNTFKKTYIVQGIAGSSTPIGRQGIGTWNVDGSDETGWIPIPALVGIHNYEHEIKITYDPAKSGMILKGGYIIDDSTGKMAIKFANTISEADTHTAVIGIEIIINRTGSTPVSF